MGLIGHKFNFGCFHPEMVDTIIVLEENFYPENSAIYDLIQNKAKIDLDEPDGEEGGDLIYQDPNILASLVEDDPMDKTGTEL